MIYTADCGVPIARLPEGSLPCEDRPKAVKVIRHGEEKLIIPNKEATEHGMPPFDIHSRSNPQK
jgi:hypothetical protein